jgi:hypothetical protein
MIFKTVFILVILVLTVVLIAGCGGPPEGTKGFRELVDREKESMAEIALKTQEAKDSLDRYGTYSTAFGWGYLKWSKRDGEYQTGGYNIIMGEDIEENPFKESERDGELYYIVILFFGEPAKEEVIVAINPNIGETARVWGMDIKGYR